MFILYQILIFIIILLSPFIISYRIVKNKEDSKRILEKFSISSKKRKKGKLIWFHGASVGEILSIIPLIKNFEKKKEISQILITSSTLSSSKVLKKYNFKKTIHQFYPIDFFFITRKFINFWKPSVAIFIDSEIWPSMFKIINNNKTPLILLNARITKKTFKRWMKIKNFSESVFGMITAAYPQNLETKIYLKKLNTKKIHQIGNLKFAENYENKLENISNRLKTEFNKKKIWISSSTHNEEEVFCAKAHLELKKKIKNLLTIIIPRHVHRVEEIVIKLKKLGLKVFLHSSKSRNLKNVDIYIVDTFGETKKFHKLGSSVFLGGSIINRGGQNPLEAARLGAKILHGSNVDNFKDVYKLLKSLNISKKITSPKELSSSIIFRSNKNNGVKIKNIGEKILKKTIKELQYFISNEFKKT